MDSDQIEFGIFISYDRQDEGYARSIFEDLTSRGVKVWMDQRSAPLGTPFPQEIELGMTKSIAAVFVVTKRSSSKLRASPGVNNWLREELNLAKSLSVSRQPPLRIIPLRFENAHVPDSLTTYTWLDCSPPADLAERLGQVISAIQMPVAVRDAPAQQHDAGGATTEKIIASARRSLVVYGHTLDMFAESNTALEALREILRAGVRVTLILLNPDSPYAKAHAPFHLFESRSSAEEESANSIAQFFNLFTACDEPRGFSVYLSSYMPRFRSMVVDDDIAYLHLYLYGHNVPSLCDMELRRSGAAKNARLFDAVVQSTQQLLSSPDVVPLIRDGVAHPDWRNRYEAKSYDWPFERRKRYVTTRNFYRREANNFRIRFGDTMEVYVKDYLDTLGANARDLNAPVLVIGCGTGKEFKHLQAQSCSGLAIDSSPEVIDLARTDHPSLERSFQVEDLYNLHCFPSEKYGAVVANAALVHLAERNDVGSVLKEIRRILKPKGLAFIRMLNKLGTHEEYDSLLFENMRWFVYFTLRELQTAAELAELTVLDASEHPHAHYKHVSWPCLLLQRP